MAASIIIHSQAERVTVHGTEQEIADVVRGLTAGFEKRGGAWLTNGSWCLWVPASTPLQVDLGDEQLEGVPMVPLPGGQL